MKAGIIQSNYIPWRGYFDFIRSVDVFVLYDDVTYSKGTYRNRNQLKFADGLRWITVPVHASITLPIDQIRIAGTTWKDRHEQMIRESLSHAPFLADALALWREGATPAPEFLSVLNRRLLAVICRYLGITTPMVDAREYTPSGKGTERVIDLLKKLGATSYLSGPSARDYLEEPLFREHGIRLEYKNYDYPEYPQGPGPFAGSVSVLDLIANCGPAAARLTTSTAPDQVAVP